MRKFCNAPSVTEYIVKHYADGDTLTKLAKAFGISHPTIIRILRDNGISPRRTWAKTVRTCRYCNVEKDVSAFYYKKYVCKKCIPAHYLKKGYSLKKYGITYDDYLNMLDAQDNRCAICNDEFIKRPYIDHDHETGRVRGLLCGGCNAVLGRFKDKEATLLWAIEYLKAQ